MGKVNLVLTPREKKFLLQRFAANPEWEKKTLAELGEDEGISRERVREIISNGVRKLISRYCMEGDMVVVSDSMKIWEIKQNKKKVGKAKN